MKLESLIPIAAPAPVGVVMGVKLYTEIINALGGNVTPIWQYIAGFFAIIGCVAVIGAEMSAYKYAGKALADKEPGAAGVSILIGLALSFAIGLAIWSSADSRPLIVALLAAIGAYAVDAVRNYVTRKAEKRNESQATQAQGMDYALRMKELETQQAKANARAARAQAIASTANTVRPVRQRTDEQEKKLDAARLAAVRAYIADKVSKNEKYTIREVAQACGIPSSSTASDYIKAAQQ